MPLYHHIGDKPSTHLSPNRCFITTHRIGDVSHVINVRLPQNRIKEFRDRKGWSMADLASAAQTSAQQINRLEKGHRKLTVDWMMRLSAALGCNPKDLMATDEEPETAPPIEIASDASKMLADLPASLRATPIHFGNPDLPIRGRAQGGSRGVLMIPVEQDPVAWTLRPPQLVGVADAFAVYAYDDSMHPMYKHGQILWVHPGMTPQVGEGILIVKNSDEALIKELVRRTEKALHVREYNPRRREFTIAQSDIRQIYRIIGALSLR